MKAFVVAAAMMVPMAAMADVPVPSGSVGGTTIVVNAGTGDQDDPHVSGDLAAYTDKSNPNWAIRYFNFLTNSDSAVPAGGIRDLLSDVSSTRITFSRVMTDRTACMVYDVPSATLVEVAGAPGTSRFGTAIGANTVAFVEGNAGNGDILTVDLPAGLPLNLSASVDVDENPAVAPSGNAVVWVRFSPATGSDVMKAIRTGGVWASASVVSATLDPEENPDTDGTTIVYDSDRGGERDVFLQPLAGGAEARLELEGVQANASISDGIVAFESTGLEIDSKADLFVYEIATNRMFQVTNTATIGEHLNDVSVLADGSVRLVWAAEEATDSASHDVFARTFQLPAGTGGGTGGGAGGGAGGGDPCDDDDDDDHGHHDDDDDDNGHHDDDDDDGHDDDDDDCTHHHHHGQGHHHHGNGHGNGHCKSNNHHGHGQQHHGSHGGKGSKKHNGFGHGHGSSSQHLDAPSDGAQGCSATGGLAPMLLGAIALMLMIRRPAAVRMRVRRK